MTENELPCETPHTKQQWSFFIHVLALFTDDVVEPLVESMAEAGIDCLLNFFAEDVNYLISEFIVKEENLNIKEKRMLKNIHVWLTWESTNRSSIDFGTLTMTDYDEYFTQKFTGSTNPQPDIPTSTTLPTVM